MSDVQHPTWNRRLIVWLAVAAAMVASLMYGQNSITQHKAKLVCRHHIQGMIEKRSPARITTEEFEKDAEFLYRHFASQRIRELRCSAIRVEKTGKMEVYLITVADEIHVFVNEL